MLKLFYYILLCSVLSSCLLVKKHAHSSLISTTPALIVQIKKGWINYQLYKISDTTVSKIRSMQFAIRIVNTLDNLSPLRKLSNNLDMYNTYYAYLLTQAKYDLLLLTERNKAYPCTNFTFENNYNAFPFDAFTFGFSLAGSNKNRKAQKYIQYIDQVFTKDTILFQLPKASH
jgi:hypothetical protein